MNSYIYFYGEIIAIIFIAKQICFITHGGQIFRYYKFIVSLVRAIIIVVWSIRVILQ